MKKILITCFLFSIKAITANAQTEIYDYEYLAMCDDGATNFYRLTMMKPDVDTIIFVKQFTATTYGFADYIPSGVVTIGSCSTGGGGGCCESALNVGTDGVGVYETQTGLTFKFRNINAKDGTLTVELDTANFNIDLSVNIDSLVGIEISQIDSLYTYLNLKQTGIQWRDEGVNKGSKGALDTVDIVGIGLTGANSGAKFTITHDPNINELNGLDTIVQYLQVAEGGTNFNINSSGSTHTFNLPIADYATTGKLSYTDWITFNAKVPPTRTISTTSPLSGGGDLSANRTFSLANGDYGDIDASSNWTSLTLDTNSVMRIDLQDSCASFAKIQSIPKNRLLGRQGSSYGNIEPIVIGTNLSLSNDTLNVSGMATYTDENAQDAVGAMINSSLNYVDGTPLLHIADRDNGDITTSASGLTWNIDAGVIGNTEIADSSITAPKIISNAVTTTALASGSVTTLKLADSSVTEVKLISNSVGTTALKSSSVTSLKITDGTIATADLSDSLITTAKILSNAVGTTALASNSVSLLKMADNSVDSTNIVADGVTMSKLDQGGATSGQVITWNGTDWRPATPSSPDFDIQNKFEYFNDFTDLFGTSGIVGTMHVVVAGTGANHGPVATLSTYGMGEAELTTGTQSNGYAGVFSRKPTLFFGYGSWDFKYSHYVDSLSYAGQRYASLVGFIDAETVVDQVDGCYFLYDEGGVSSGSAASANWQCVTANNSTRTFTTTATAVTAGAYQKLQIVMNAAGTSVTFYINGASVATHTTNIPTTAARNTGFGVFLKKSVGIIPRYSRNDYLYVKCNFTTGR